MASPKRSIRPKARPLGQVLRERNKPSEEFGDVELRWQVDPALRDDPLARLGYEGGLKFLGKEAQDEDGAWYIPSGMSKEQVPSYVTDMYVGSEGVSPDDVAYSAGYASSPHVLGHEMRHRGLQRIVDMYNEDPDWFSTTFGEDAASYVDFFSNEPSQSHETNEAFTEIGDEPHVDESWLDAHGSSQKQRTLGETITTDEGFRKDPRVRKAYEGIQKAAQHALTQKGEPPRAVPKQVQEEGEGWFGSLLQKIGFAEGGLTRQERRNQFHTNRYDKQMEESGLSAGLETPMGMMARPKFGAMSELGGPVYEMVGGQQVTIRPETREEIAGRENIVGTGKRVIRTLGDYLKNPSLPSAGQVASAAGAVAKGVAESAGRVARSEGTLGEAMGFAATPTSVASTARVPAGALTSGAARRQSGKENPIFRSRRTVTSDEVDFEDYPLMEFTEAPYSFYSPIRNTVENMDFGKNDTMSGAAIQSELNRVLNQGQGIRNAELAAADLPIDPKKRYTKEEAMKLAYDNTWEIKPIYDRSYRTEQRVATNDRQSTFDPESPREPYFEITLEASKPKGGTFEPARAGLGDPGTHYTKNTVAHLRGSEKISGKGSANGLIEPGEHYLLIEELQSDLFSKGTKPKEKGRAPITREEVDELVKKGEITAREGENLMRGKDPIKDAPFSKDEDWLRLTILSAIAEAQARGVNKVVIPDAKELADLRYTVSETTGNKVRLAETQKSGFYRLYGKTLDKVIRQLEGELGTIDRKKDKIPGSPYEGYDLDRFEEAKSNLEEFSEVTDIPFDEAAQMTYDELAEELKDIFGGDVQVYEPISNFQEDYFEYTQGLLDMKDKEVTVIDLSNLPVMKESEMRFAQGGLVDYLSPDRFADYLEERNG